MNDKIDEFINKNRAIIDEFTGPNHSRYENIILKGRLMKLMGKQKAFEFFNSILHLEVPYQNTHLYLKIQELEGDKKK